MLQENWWILSRKAKRRKRMGNDNLSHGCFSSSFASSPSDTIFFPSPPSKAICGIVPWLVLRKMNFHLHLFAHCQRWFSGRRKKKSWFFSFLGRRHQRSPKRRKRKEKSFLLFSFSSGGGFLRGVNLAKFGNFHWREEETGKKEGVQGGQNMFVFPPFPIFPFSAAAEIWMGGPISIRKKGKVKHFSPSPLSEKEKRGSWLGLSETHNTFLFLRFCLTRPNIFLILSLFPLLPREKALETWPKNTTTNTKGGKPRKPHTSVSLRCTRKNALKRDLFPFWKIQVKLPCITLRVYANSVFPERKTRKKASVLWSSWHFGKQTGSLIYRSNRERCGNCYYTTFIFPYFVARFSERYYLGDGVRR